MTKLEQCSLSFCQIGKSCQVISTHTRRWNNFMDLALAKSFFSSDSSKFNFLRKNLLGIFNIWARHFTLISYHWALFLEPWLVADGGSWTLILNLIFVDAVIANAWGGHWLCIDEHLIWLGNAWWDDEYVVERLDTDHLLNLVARADRCNLSVGVRSAEAESRTCSQSGLRDFIFPN